MQGINFRKPEPSTVIYATLGVLMIGLICIWLSMFFLHLRVNRALRIDLDRPAVTSNAATTNKNQSPKNQSSPAATIPKEFQDMVKGKGIFGKIPDAQLQLQAILGDSVLIDGQWIKGGEKQGDVKVLEIRSDKAVIEFKGNRREIQIWPNLPGT